MVRQVTGLAPIAMMGEQFREVQFTWEYRDLPTLARRYVVIDGSGSAMARRYDDGWRIDEVTLKYNSSAPQFSAIELAEMQRDVEAEAVRLAGEMVAIPAGSFQMGCVEGVDCLDGERPVHNVAVRAFRLGKYEATFAQYDAFAEATSRAKPDDEGWGRGNRPVINVSWDDAQAFARWVSEKTGQRYRLPTEAEWEYAARGRTTTAYSWGGQVGSGRANCWGCGSEWDGQTAPVGSFTENPFGLHDVHGNVSEWVEDCGNDDYNGAPTNGSSWTRGDCSRRMLRGGSWYFDPSNLRSAHRDGIPTSYSGDNAIGFRLAQDTL